ncbi:hypothetical protein K435DRAFT_862577 [Dendrothele bispora CBS 962.96]|uniref:CCHC-type domain-containing protein n=1 Tax=Dendrothele bispora (strain CBS 962.96) TaxID=1314807 RepID=A0A4S8LSR3_DENBC|nr:hypothetical protein K435DRAFT_862577 [Dendrothele bispora CBS 962.96]
MSKYRRLRVKALTSNKIKGINDQTHAKERVDILKDPPVPNPKGRPRTLRITGADEGRIQGGGGPKVPRKCGNCKQTGHCRDKCPYLSK